MAYTYILCVPAVDNLVACQLLVEHGAQPDAKTDEEGMTGMHVYVFDNCRVY